MRRVLGYVTGLQRVEFTNKAGESVRRVMVHWFGNPLEAEGETGFEARSDSVDSKDVSREVVPSGVPVKATLMIEDRDVNAEVFGRRMRVKIPRLRAVEVWKP